MQLPQRSIRSIIDALRSKGYKATPQRIAICQFVLSSREHPSIQKIYLAVKKTHPTVSLATVYKTLQILKEISLVQELNFPQDPTRFDAYAEPHINLVCLRCGSIQDLECLTARDLLKGVLAETRFVPTGQRLDVYGFCEKCSGKNNSP